MQSQIGWFSNTALEKSYYYLYSMELSLCPELSLEFEVLSLLSEVSLELWESSWKKAREVDLNRDVG